MIPDARFRCLGAPFSDTHAQDDLFIMEEYPEPPVCRPERLFVRHAIPRLRSDVIVNCAGQRVELEVDFGQVQPGAESWTRRTNYRGVGHDGSPLHRQVGR